MIIVIAIVVALILLGALAFIGVRNSSLAFVWQYL